MTAKKAEPDLSYRVVLSRSQFVVVQHSPAWQPPTDVLEGDSYIYVMMEIGGMRDGEFHVAVSGQRLMVTGHRPIPVFADAGEKLAYHQFEVRFGEFRTVLTLPWIIDETGIHARYEDGFLYITIPRVGDSSTRVIHVDR